MKKHSRSFHIYLSLFLLPMALLYALSGALFLCRFDENTGAKIQSYVFEKDSSKDEFGNLMHFLEQNKLALPLNKAIHSKDENVILSLGTPYYSVSLKALNANQYELSTIKASFVGLLMNLHEAKDNSIFNILAFSFAAVLFILYITGFIITFFAMSKNKRKPQYIAIFSGLFVCIFLACLKIFYAL